MTQRDIPCILMRGGTSRAPYYNRADPVMSDADYDAAYKRNIEIERAFPDQKRKDSPSDTVGAPVQPDAGSQTASVMPIPGTFIGSTPLDPKPLSDPDYERHLAREQIRSLNCLAAGQTLPDRERDSLGSVKFSLMARVWSDDWGSARDFDNWVRGLSTASPNTAARAVFEEVHEPC